MNYVKCARFVKATVLITFFMVLLLGLLQKIPIASAQITSPVHTGSANSSPPILGQTIPPVPGTITVTASVADTTDEWAFGFTLNYGSPLVATKAVPTVGWSNLAPNQVYTLTEIDPGLPWLVGVFTCTLNGSPIADADTESIDFQLFLGADDSVVCSITNSMIPPTCGPNENTCYPEENPSKAFLPIVAN
ncbi:MAG: hypothetical protein U0X20_26375 [Caldilineaceae bacterium]